MLGNGADGVGLVNRFAPLLQKNATLEDPSRVIVTASVAGLGVGSTGETATFGYSASKGKSYSYSLINRSQSGQTHC